MSRNIFPLKDLKAIDYALSRCSTQPLTLLGLDPNSPEDRQTFETICSVSSRVKKKLSNVEREQNKITRKD